MYKAIRKTDVYKSRKPNEASEEDLYKWYVPENWPILNYASDYRIYLKIDGGDNYEDLECKYNPLTLRAGKGDILADRPDTEALWPYLIPPVCCSDGYHQGRDIFNMDKVNLPEGCKLMYKIDNENKWKEYNRKNWPVLLEARSYKVYLMIDGGGNYEDLVYNGNPMSLVAESGYYNWTMIENSKQNGQKDNSSSKKEVGTDNNTIESYRNQNKGVEGDRRKQSLKDIQLPSELKFKKYIVGYPDKTFRPEDWITRAELSQVIYKLIYNVQEKTFGVSYDFIDVDQNAWYGKAVGYLSYKKIINGYEDKFRPDNLVTRAEMAQILFNVLRLYDEDPLDGYEYGDYEYNFEGLNDLKTSWANESIKQLASNVMIKGYEDGTFNLSSNVTRAEVVAMVSRILGREANENEFTKSKFNDLDNSHWAFEYIMDATE